MQERFSLGIDIVDETESDRVRAKMVEFGTAGESDRKIDEAARRPLFASKEASKATSASAPKVKKRKAEVKAEQSRHDLQQTLVGNTRVVIDPFLTDRSRTNTKPNFGILKRKRSTEQTSSPSSNPSSISVTQDNGVKQLSPSIPPTTLPTSLVAYDSD
jgi:coiled-coil domain-containing protein 130